jgi:hypothetical protein
LQATQVRAANDGIKKSPNEESYGQFKGTSVLQCDHLKIILSKSSMIVSMVDDLLDE